MKLSIWKKANYRPKTKEEKVQLAKLTSGANIPEVIEVNNDEDLIKAITTFSWSPSIFYGNRSNDNFLSTDFIVLDIDDGCSIEQSEARVKKLGIAALCLPSPSFTIENQKHRLIFPLCKTINSVKIFESTLQSLFVHFPEADPSCTDAARWYCVSSIDDGFYQDGEFLLPVEKDAEPEMEYNTSEVHLEVTDDIEKVVEELYGEKRAKIPEAVHFFLKNAHTGIHGGWTNALNSAAFSLALSGIDDTIIWEVCDRLCPDGALDKKDKYQVTRAIRDGKKKREF